jgi:hypothetical protein
MRKSDYNSIYELYSKVENSEILTESYSEGTTVLPTLIKINETYEGGPSAGKVDITYRIIGRMRNVVQGVCENNSHLDCAIEIDDPTVVEEGNAYITSAHFVWDSKKNEYKEKAS